MMASVTAARSTSYLPEVRKSIGGFKMRRATKAGVITTILAAGCLLWILALTPKTDLFVPNTLTIIAAGSFGQNISFWIDNDISAAGSGAGGGLGDGYLKFDVGHYIGLPSRALNVRFGQFELDLPFSQARTIYPSAYDAFGETAVAQPSTTTGQTVFQTTNNPFFIGTPQRGIEIGGYANSRNFTW